MQPLHGGDDPPHGDDEGVRDTIHSGARGFEEVIVKMMPEAGRLELLL
jgi:hypothetical protein